MRWWIKKVVAQSIMKSKQSDLMFVIPQLQLTKIGSFSDGVGQDVTLSGEVANNDDASQESDRLASQTQPQSHETSRHRSVGPPESGWSSTPAQSALRTESVNIAASSLSASVSGLNVFHFVSRSVLHSNLA